MSAVRAIFSKSRALWALAGLAIAAAAVMTVLSVGGDDDGRAERSVSAGLTTTVVERRDLAEYAELSGQLDYAEPVSLTSASGGVLSFLAPEGSVVAQGERLYVVVNDPTADDLASVLARLESSQDALLTAQDRLSEAVSGPSESDIASARTAVDAAIETRDRLVEAPGEAEIEAAEANVLAAGQAFADLRNPSEATLSAARAHLASAETDLDDLLSSPTQADIDSAEASLRVAEADLADLLEGPSEADIAAARAAVLTAEENVELFYTGATLATAEAQLAQAREALEELLAGPSQATLDRAEAAVTTAREALADVMAGPTQSQIDAARAAVLAAEESLDSLENPTEAAQAMTSADVAQAEEALADLLEGPSKAEVDSADAAVLAAEEALADLLDGTSSAELAVLEQAVESAHADVAAAEADQSALGDLVGSKVLMYGTAPVYRTMTQAMRGDDVSQLQQNLLDLGHAESPDFTVDGVFDEATAESVRSWQSATGRTPDGSVGPHDIVFVPGPVQISAWGAGIEIGQDVVTGSTLASLTVIEAPVDGEMSTTQRVVATLPLSDRNLLSEGVSVNVELPDGEDLAGTVIDINPAPMRDEQTGESSVEATIKLLEPASDVWIGATVQVEVTETLIRDALVVPATALLALVEGGYAVEVVGDDGSVRLVGVEPGLFVDGDVEISGAAVDIGMRVVIPR